LKSSQKKPEYFGFFSLKVASKECSLFFYTFEKKSKMTFKNSPFQSIRIILLTGITLLTGAGAVYIIQTTEISFPYILILLPLTLYLLITDLHYFKTTEDALEIKNYLLPFLNKTILFAETESITITRPQKSAIGIRVHTTTGRSRFYSACTLKNETWKLFIKHLKDRNIHVTNEAVL
jgi:hypothetical protein